MKPTSKAPWTVGIALAAGCVALAIAATADAPEGDESTATKPDAKPATLHPVHIRPANPAPRLRIETEDGQTVAVACSTCHSTRPPNHENRLGEDLDRFHQGLEVAHGANTCLSCHHQDDYDRLRLADGRAIGFSEVMTLCAQCHGPQARDYERGAHGGMTGYWDLSRGPRTRNHCIHCHDPHAPAFPRMIPTFKPHDRFLTGTTNASHGDHDEP